MRKVIVIFAAILIYIVVFGSIACLLLPIGNFHSLEVKSEVKVLPMSDTDPVEYLRYSPTISFRDGQLIQQESDFFYAGPSVCRFGGVAAYDASDTLRLAGYTPFFGVLFWDRQLYLNLTQFPFFLILLLVGMRVYKRFRKGSL